jgi:hypothetical protein
MRNVALGARCVNFVPHERVRMTIDEQGFLSPEIAAWIEKHRAEHRPWFTLAMNLNAAAHQLLLKIPLDDEVFLLTLLFVRGLTSFQAAIILAERGMTQDARTVARSCFETVFCFGAVRQDQGFIEKFEKAAVHSKKTFANAQLAGSSKLEPEAADILDQFLRDLAQTGEEGEPFVWKEVAKLAGLSGVYDVYYRGLSNDAAHPSLIALKRFWDAKENNVTLRYGPDVGDVKDTLIAACTAFWYLVAWTAERLEHDENNEKLRQCFERYKQLIEIEKATRAP